MRASSHSRRPTSGIPEYRHDLFAHSCPCFSLRCSSRRWCCRSPPQPDRDPHSFQLVEATIADIEQAFQSGLLEPAQLVGMYAARIAAYDHAGPGLNSYMAVNPQAIADARALDAERRRNRGNG